MRRSLALLLVVSLSGCGSFMGLSGFRGGRFGVGKIGDELPSPYRGVLVDLNAIRRGFVPAILDLPLTLALDTTLLPFTLPVWLVKAIRGWPAPDLEYIEVPASTAPVVSDRWPGMQLAVGPGRVLACVAGRLTPLRVVGQPGGCVTVTVRAQPRVVRGLVVRGEELLTPSSEEGDLSELFRRTAYLDADGVLEVTVLGRDGGEAWIEAR